DWPARLARDTMYWHPAAAYTAVPKQSLTEHRTLDHSPSMPKPTLMQRKTPYRWQPLHSVQPPCDSRPCLVCLLACALTWSSTAWPTTHGAMAKSRLMAAAHKCVRCFMSGTRPKQSSGH